MQGCRTYPPFFVSLRAPSWAFLVLLAITFSGCGAPNAANIVLRKQNQDLQKQVDDLGAQHQRDVDTLAACQRSHPTVPTLSTERLDQLVTTHGLSFGRLTGGDNPDATAASDTELKVAVVPLDADGTPIKAAGTFKVEAFDLADPAKPLVGSWIFDLNQTRSSFYSQLSLYTYVLICPLSGKLAHPDLTVHVTFADALTGREFVGQVPAKVRLPSTGP